MNDYIKEAQVHTFPVGMYGLGIWGSKFSWTLFSYLEVSIDFVADNDVNKLNEFKRENIKKLTNQELLSAQSEIILFVMVGQFYIKEVMNTLKQNKNLKLITLDDILDCDVVLEKFYGVNNIKSYEKKFNLRPRIEKRKSRENNKNIAIYTCIINKYDEVHEPLVVEEGCDYFIISDRQPENLKVFKWINYKEVVPAEYTEPAVINRYCKMHAHNIFSEYEYSIYMDGKLGIGIHKHGFIDCIYVEGIRMVGVGTSDSTEVINQMRRYIQNGMPRHYGTFECRMIVRDHNNISGNKIMEEWFGEYYHNARRDQFSLSYILWKNGWRYDDVGLIRNGVSWDCNDDIVCMKKHLK